MRVGWISCSDPACSLSAASRPFAFRSQSFRALTQLASLSPFCVSLSESKSNGEKEVCERESGREGRSEGSAEAKTDSPSLPQSACPSVSCPPLLSFTLFPPTTEFSLHLLHHALPLHLLHHPSASLHLRLSLYESRQLKTAQISVCPIAADRHRIRTAFTFKMFGLTYSESLWPQLTLAKLMPTQRQNISIGNNSAVYDINNLCKKAANQDSQASVSRQRFERLVTEDRR